MDVAALAQTILSARAGASQTDVQVSMLKKAMDTESAAMTTLVDSLPLATSGNLGRNVNTYA